MEIFKNIFSNKLTSFFTSSLCLQNELTKILNDIFLLVDTGIAQKSIQESNLEKFANVTILNIPSNFWSILILEKNICNVLIIILALPLIFCLFLLIVYLRNQIKVMLMGYWTKLEYKTLNFSLFTKESWRILWSYAYDFVP